MKNIIIMIAIVAVGLFVGCGKVTGPTAATETAGAAVSRVAFVEPDGVAYAMGVQGTIRVVRGGIVACNLATGMTLDDDDQLLFMDRRGRCEIQSMIADVPPVTIVAGDEGYWDAETGQLCPPDPDWAYSRGISYSAFW